MKGTLPTHSERLLGGTIRTTLAVVTVGVLIAGSFVVLQPFIPAFIWAAMIVIATWPLMIRLQSFLGGRRGLATFIMTVLLLLLLFVPLWVAIDTIATNASAVVGWAQYLTQTEPPAAPDWVKELPMVGDYLTAKWEHIRMSQRADIVRTLYPYVSSVLSWFVAQAGTIGMLFLHFLLTVALAAVLYTNGEVAANQIVRFATRLGGEHGTGAVILAGKAVRAVALGIVVTALSQSIVAGAGLYVVGVPFAAFLTASIFMLGITQIGPMPIMLPTVIWLFWSGRTGWGVAFLIWTVIVGLMDNLLRPVLIKRGANLPIILVLAGVIGGLLAFGVLGLFIGPVVLVVTWTLMQAWIAQVPSYTPEPAAAEPAPVAGNDPTPSPI